LIKMEMDSMDIDYDHSMEYESDYDDVCVDLYRSTDLGGYSE